jgi:hypothetical protein
METHIAFTAQVIDLCLIKIISINQLLSLLVVLQRKSTVYPALTADTAVTAIERIE